MCLALPPFLPMTWVCKKHGAVSHSSTEAEVIALDAALRIEGIPALMLWDTVIDVLSSTRGDPSQKASASGGQSQLTAYSETRSSPRPVRKGEPQRFASFVCSRS